MLMRPLLNEVLECTIQDNVIIGPHRERTETRNAAQIMMDALNEHPKFTCRIIAETGEKLKFEEVKIRSIKLAIWLKKRGILENEVVAVVTDQHKYDFIPFLATLFVNAIYNPWPHNLSEPEVLNYFQTCRPKFMIGPPKIIARIFGLAYFHKVTCQFIVDSEEKQNMHPTMYTICEDQTAEEVEKFRCVTTKPAKNDVNMIFFSSGKTGMPKEIKLNYDFLIRDGPNEVQKQSKKRSHRWLWYDTLSKLSGTLYVFYMIQWRFMHVLHLNGYDPQLTSRVIRRLRVSVVAHTPIMLTISCKSNVFNFPDYESVRLIIYSGSTINRNILNRCKDLLEGVMFANFYYLTEAGQYITRQTRQCVNRAISNSVGFVCPNIALKIMDLVTRQALPADKKGEICFKTSNVMSGYLSDVKGTKATIDEEGWMHTGDWGYWTGKGEIVIVDRMVNLFQIDQYSASTAEIENILLEHDSIQECAVVLIPKEGGTSGSMRPFAFVTLHGYASPRSNHLVQYVRRANEHYDLTHLGLIQVDRLLYIASGHTDNQTLKEKALKLLRFWRLALPDFTGIESYATDLTRPDPYNYVNDYFYYG